MPMIWRLRISVQEPPDVPRGQTPRIIGCSAGGETDLGVDFIRRSETASHRQGEGQNAGDEPHQTELNWATGR